ncbi:MAG: transporter substrate-binding domain-containing protein [Mediterranea sp.]|jgi:ABC-type amino acid transport substrate-binding protein|nr:transporter substrate-binding domain-containing protein [Mediterranea sp.]
MKSAAQRLALRYALPVVAVTLFFSIRHCGQPRQKPAGQPRDYADIVRQGTLRATTEYNSVSFYVNGDSIAGFHYELIRAFARDKGLKAEITPLMSVDDRLKGLADGRFDIIAYNILSTDQLRDSLLLTSPILLNRQVLVQRKATAENDSTYIHSQLELAGKTVSVVRNSPAIPRIRHLGEEIGDTIYVSEVERYGPEQLIDMVAHGDIDYAVCDEGIARAVLDSFPQLDMRTAIGFTQFYSWAVSKRSPVLLDSLDRWLERFKPSAEYRRIYREYYGKE